MTEQTLELAAVKVLAELAATHVEVGKDQYECELGRIGIEFETNIDPGLASDPALQFVDPETGRRFQINSIIVQATEIPE